MTGIMCWWEMNHLAEILSSKNVSLRYEHQNTGRIELWINHPAIGLFEFRNSDEYIKVDPIKYIRDNFIISKTEHEKYEEKTLKHELFADRYGGSFGTIHGGSGRCGSTPFFNAKGLGPTPLVSPGADWGHSHGCLFLYDALREVVSGEILRAETPHGAIPIVAAIDGGFAIPPGPDEPPERCGIIVRPNFVRAAHFERSVFFGTSGFEGSDQYIDSLRVRDMVRYADNHLATPGGAHPGFDLGRMFMAFADQVATTRAHRIWPGRPLTDNLTVKGEYLDYGCFRSLPNWKAANDDNRQIFGLDITDFRNSVDSLIHFFRKYSVHGPSVRNPVALLNAVQERITATFKAVCTTSCGFTPDGPSGRRAAELLLAYYHHQQQSRYQLSEPTARWRRKDWLFYDLPPTPLNPQSAHGAVARELASLLLDGQDDDGIPGPARWAAARRWLSPRPLQYYHLSKARARRVVRQLERPGADAGRLVGDYLAHEVALSRRVWPAIEASQVILGFSTDIISSVVFTYDVRARVYLAILTGPYVGSDTTLFGRQLRVGDATSIHGSQVEIRLPIHPHSLRRPQEVSLWGQSLHLPAAKLVFRDGLTVASILEERVRYG